MSGNNNYNIRGAEAETSKKVNVRKTDWIKLYSKVFQINDAEFYIEMNGVYTVAQHWARL